jgi:DnaJ-class molecular chaperone
MMTCLNCYGTGKEVSEDERTTVECESCNGAGVVDNQPITAFTGSDLVRGRFQV